IVNSQCGTSTGMITIQASGGVVPLMYALNNGAFGLPNSFSGLASGTYTINVKGTNGCEVSQVVNVASFGAQTSALSDSFCAGDSYQINGNIYTLPGTYIDTLPNGASNGCDSIITLKLSMNPLKTKTITASICKGDVFSINGVDYGTAGQYLIDTIPALTGCDTIRTLNLTVNPLETKTLTVSICGNEVYSINGVDYSVAGQYLIDTVAAAIGCDTIRTLDLTIYPLESTKLNISICNGTVYTYNGVDYGVQGQYVIDTINAAIGCDSILTLNLTVSDYISSIINASICEGDVYTINGIDYTVTGLYLIDTIVNPTSCDTIRTLNLTVYPLPSANAGNDQLLNCNVQSVILNGTATGGTPLWTGPGIDITNQNVLTPTVTQPGNYILTITSPNNCVAEDSVLVTLDPSTVVANATVDTFLSCDIDTVVLQAEPVGAEFNYQWSGPGINASNEYLVNPIVTVAGVYTLVVTNTLTNCVSQPVNVFVEDKTTNIVAIIQAPDSLTCFSTFVDLNATGSTVGPNIAYIWFDENGNIVSNSPFLEVTSGGMFMFLVKDTISGCFDSTSVFVKDLRAYPPVVAGDPQQLDCNHQTVILNEGSTNNLLNVIFNWTGPAGGILTTPTLLSIQVGTGGEYVIIATDTITGCVNSDTVLVTDLSQLPFIEIRLVQQFTCQDSTAIIDIGSSEVGSDINYEWNGPLTNGVTSDSIEPTLPGWYYLTVANSATGCSALDSILLQLPALPIGVQANIMVPLCAGDLSGSLMIDSVTGGTPLYMYSINGMPSQTSPLFTDLQAGNYSVVVTDANGCSFEEAFTVPDGQVLDINIGQDIQLVLGDSAQLSAIVNLPWSQIDSIVWASGIHLSCDHCIDPTLYGLLNEIISATVYAGSCVDSDQISIRVDVDANVYIPNVFSPNGDGINDWVTVFADDRVRKVVYLEIFDRWGNQVFVANNFVPNEPTLGWNGTFKNLPMNPGVFAYVAKVELINGVQIPFKGDITLLR
ncbi:MAG: gliding motility-associated C-terminal domain-containing protein, partial [Saprospiraceae bacterium]